MQEERNSNTVVWIAIPILLLAGFAAWYLGREEPAEPPVAAPAAEPVEPVAAEPRHPVEPPPAAEEPRGELQPLPSLDDSDEYFKLEMRGLLGDAVPPLSDALIERLVATIDNLPRAAVAERVRPVGPPGTPFAVSGQDGSGEFLLGPDNFRRYDALARQIARVDPGEAAEVYRRYYPLFQKAYVGLGYPDGYFNDRLVEVIDHLLATPEVEGPIALVRPHVLYQFADPELEALSAGQKLMLRIGPENRELVSDALRDFRARIASGED